MNIVADENIPELDRYFSGVANVTKMNGRALGAGDLRDADALLVRSVTRVDKDLLQGSRVKFVGTATIGTDHIDLDYLKQQGIGFANAPGANANSVVEYVIAALCHLGAQIGPIAGQRIAVIGCGNVGGALYRTLERLGADVVTYDPLLISTSHAYKRVTYREALSRNVVCFHTPLTHQGAFPTYHMLNAKSLEWLTPGTVVINAGRGAVIDNQALLQRLSTRQDLSCVLDVWEGEPGINLELLGRCALATPHIAGYSYDGKVAGTRMITSAFRQHFSLQAEPSVFVEEPKSIRAFGENTWSAFCGLIRNAYNIMADDQRFRQQMSTASDSDERAQRFDVLRKTYPIRREWQHYQVGLNDRADKMQLAEMVKNVGFITK